MKIAKIIDKNTIEVYDLSQFDLSAIMHSGQVFRYFEVGEDEYELVVGSHYAHMYRCDNKVVIKCSDADYFYQYFDFGTDYDVIKKEIACSESFASILKLSGGIRILKSDFFEMTISFIISANNNIKRFTKTLNLLAEKFGVKLENGRYSFPVLMQLEIATDNDFKEIGCGYRSVYLVKAIQQLKNLDYYMLQKLPNDELLKSLLRIQGVGPKVAACIMLFAFHRLDVAPIDTWITKALDSLGDDKKILLSHKFSGVYQQYIFHYLQHLKQIIW